MDENIRFADQQHAEALARLQHTVAYSQGGLNACILVNGGALIALFSLIAPQRELASKLWVSGLWFAVALSLTLVAWLCATLSQDRFQIASTYQAWNAEAKCAGQPEGHDVTSPVKLGNRFMLAGYAAILLSMLAFILGALSALRALAG